MLLGTCSPFAVALADGYGPTYHSQSTTISLSNSSQMAFYSDPLCLIPASSVVVPAGQTSSMFYGRALSTGSNASFLIPSNDQGFTPYSAGALGVFD
jgi:hypothetical protein